MGVAGSLGPEGELIWFGVTLHCDEAVRRSTASSGPWCFQPTQKTKGDSHGARPQQTHFDLDLDPAQSPGTGMATLFCPSCSNLLVISAETGFNKWACNTCPYEFPITKQMTSRTRLERKQVDDVLGGEEMWKHADSIAGSHPILPCLPWSTTLRSGLSRRRWFMTPALPSPY